jgi:hypothetical protein
MKLSLIAVATLSLFGATITAHAQGEGAGDPFPFRAPGIVLIHPSTFVDTGSAAYPVFSGRPGQVVTANQGTLPSNGSEGAVQTAASLPRGAFDGTVTVMQAQSTDRYFAKVAARRSATRRPMRTGHG